MKLGQASFAFFLIGAVGLTGGCGSDGGATPDGGAGTTGSAGTGSGTAGTTGGAGTTGTAGTGAAGSGAAGTGAAGSGAAGTGAAGTGAAGTGAAGTAGSTVPITQRPSRGTLQCLISRNRTDHSPRSWNSMPALVATAGGSTFVIRPEAATQNQPTTPQLLASTLNATGNFGAPTVVPSTAANVGELAAAPRGQGFAAVFVEGTNLRFVAFDGAGAIVVAPKTVLTGVDTLSTQPSLAAGPDGGFGLVFTADAGGDKREARFVALTADGATRGTPRVLNATTGTLPFLWLAPAIVSDATGYAMIWRSPSDARGGIDFAKADAAGAETVARRRISVTNVEGTVVGGTAGFDRATNALLAVDGGYIAAWTESKNGNLGDNASAEVRIVRLNASGVALAPPVPVRAGVKDIDEVEPVLVKVGSAAAIAWGHGTHIYICGGCVPNHRIDLLPIDPADLTPLGNVVSITNGAATPTTPAGGLLRKQLAVTGTSVLATYQLTFHVSATPGSAAFTCAPP